MRKSNFLLLGGAAAVALLVLMFVAIGATPGTAAPLPAPTPVSADRTGAEPRDVTFFTAEVVTADTTSGCVALANYERADIYYSVTIDSGNINTTTLTLQHGNSPDALADGLSFASAMTTTASAMQQVQLFGRYTCVKIDTTDASTGTITVTVNSLVK